MGHEDDCIDPQCGLCGGTIQMSQPKKLEMTPTCDKCQIQKQVCDEDCGAGNLHEHTLKLEFCSLHSAAPNMLETLHRVSNEAATTNELTAVILKVIATAEGRHA